MINRKGVALLWSVILVTVLMIVSGGIVSAIIKESRMTLDVVDSSQSYANAKSGLDWAQNYINNISYMEELPDLATTPKEATFDFGDQGFAKVIISKNASVYTVKSKGTNPASTVEREIKANITDSNTATSLMPTGSGTIIAKQRDIGADNLGSFELNFDLWRSNATAENVGGIGLGDSNTSSSNTSFAGISVDANAKTASLVYQIPGGGITIRPITTNPLLGLDAAVPSFTYPVKLKYTNNTSLSATIFKRDATNLSKMNCIGSVTVDLNSKSLGNLRYFSGLRADLITYANFVSTTPTGSDLTHGTGKYLDFNGGYLVDKIKISGVVGVSAPTAPPSLPTLTINKTMDSGFVSGNSKLGSLLIVTSQLGDNCDTLETCIATYGSGTSVVLTAKTIWDGYTFSAWTGCDSTSGNTCTVNITASRTVNAQFTRKADSPPPTVYRVILNGINGKISTSDGHMVSLYGFKDLYPNNSKFSVSLTPDSGYTFDRWVGSNCSQLASSGQMTVTAYTQCTAVFIPTGMTWITLSTGLKVASTNYPYGATPLTRQWSSTIANCAATTGLCDSSRVLIDPALYPWVWESTPGTTYSAQMACRTMGGRLPTKEEAAVMYTNKALLGSVPGQYYQIANEGSHLNASSIYDYALSEDMVNGGNGSDLKTNWKYVRCVR